MLQVSTKWYAAFLGKDAVWNLARFQLSSSIDQVYRAHHRRSWCQAWTPQPQCPGGGTCESGGPTIDGGNKEILGYSNQRPRKDCFWLMEVLVKNGLRCSQRRFLDIYNTGDKCIQPIFNEDRWQIPRRNCELLTNYVLVSNPSKNIFVKNYSVDSLLLTHSFIHILVQCGNNHRLWLLMLR